MCAIQRIGKKFEVRERFNSEQKQREELTLHTIFQKKVCQRKKKAPPATQNQINAAARNFKGNCDREMRQRGTSQPLAVLDLTKADKELVGTTPRNIRDLLKKNHEAFTNFKTKGFNRKVLKNQSQLIEDKSLGLKYKSLLIYFSHRNAMKRGGLKLKRQTTKWRKILKVFWQWRKKEAMKSLREDERVR